MGTLTPAGIGTGVLWEMARDQRSFLEKGMGHLTPPTKGHLAESICLSTIRAALEQAGWERLNASDGLILATTTGEAPYWEQGMISFIKHEINGAAFFPRFRLLPLGALLTGLSRELGFEGRSQLVTTACAAGIHAVALATLWVRSGLVKRCLVGGVEALCTLTTMGFKSLQLLSDQPCRPFDKNRQGINLSEGASFLCVESDPQRAPLAELLGGGYSLDAHHMTAPHPEGQGSLQALRQALQQSGVVPAEIDWIHAHGTGSLHNDLAESKAIESLFNGAPVPPVSSTKGTHGHFLGATGVIETALVIESLRRQQCLPTTGLETQDPAITLPVLRSAEKRRLNFALKNVLGFGGTNGALVVGRV